ncbi:MAG TPA: hypothetical protein VFS83_07430 [Ktedonobacterales bacterium]|nr:hypothetical protein [Ktedonobacterales bacterium]
MSHSARTSWRQLTSGVGLLLALVLTLVGCGRLPLATRSSTPTPTTPPTPAPTFTPAAAHSLNWQARTTPAPISSIYGAVSLGFSPVDSSLVWACAPSGSAARVWISRDRAVTWQRVSDIEAGGEVDACSVIPDDLDPATAVVQTDLLSKQCCVLPPIPYPMRITHDSGRTWALFHGPDDSLRQITTYHGSTYALFSHHFEDMAPFQSKFVVSMNGGRTWEPMGRLLATPNALPTYAGYVWQYWINPATGAMLAHTAAATVWMDHFLASNDGGVSWRDLQAPQADDFVVRTPFAAGPWEICGVRRSNSSAHPAWDNTMPCTLDGGATWRVRTITPIPEGFAIANDGSVLGLTGTRLMRLTPSGSDWEQLGPMNTIWMPPNSYVSGSGKGVIWKLPDSNDGTPSDTAYVAEYS